MLNVFIFAVLDIHSIYVCIYVYIFFAAAFSYFWTLLLTSRLVYAMLIATSIFFCVPSTNLFRIVAGTPVICTRIKGLHQQLD
jgi:hypothetical protein